MKRSILLFFVFCFSVLLSFLFAQSDQKSVTVSGYVSYEGRGAQPKNIEVRTANSYTQPVKASDAGFFNIRWDCSQNNNVTYLLLYRSAEHCAKIVPVSLSNYSNIRTNLRLAFLAPKSIEITIQGNVTNAEGYPIDSAWVYLDNGATVGLTNSLGHFNIDADKKNISSRTFLWIEKNSFKRKILPIDFDGSVRDTSIQNIMLEPINKTFDIEIIARRKGFRNDLVEDVTVTVNDSSIGVTDKEGILQVKDFQIDDRAEFLNFEFNHKYYVPQPLKNNLCDNISDLSIPIELEPLQQNLELFIYQAGSDGSKKSLANEAVKFRQKGLNFSAQKTDGDGRIKLEISIVPGDSLDIQLSKNMFYDPEDTLIIVEDGKKYYELGITKKNVKIEVFTRDANTKELISNIDTLAFNFASRKGFLVRSNSSFTFLSDSFLPGDEVWITALTKNYIFNPIKVEINSDSIIYSRNLFLKKINYGNLEIFSEPDSALIFLDDKATNFVTPDTMENIVEEEHRIKLTKEGYEPFEGVIYIKPNQDNAFHYQLKLLKKEVIKERKWVQCSVEGGLSGWIFRYVHGGNQKWFIPTAYPKIGFNFFFVRSLPVLLKASFFKGYFHWDDRIEFNLNEAELSCITQLGKYYLHITPRYTYLRSWKEVLAKFDGYSWDIKFSKNLGAQINNQGQLPILKNYRKMIELGFERSFKPINKSFKGDLEKENQIYLGYIYRWKQNLILISHLGYAFPATKARDEDYKDLVELKNLVRIHLTLSYFFL